MLEAGNGATDEVTEMTWSDVETVQETTEHAISRTLMSILKTAGYSAAQAWGMKVLRNSSAEEIRALSAYWPPEILRLMAEKLKDDERFI